MGKTPEIRNVLFRINQREYFPFYDYGYKLDVSAMSALMPDLKPLETGLAQSYEWFSRNREEVRRKPLFEYIDNNLKG